MEVLFALWLAVNSLRYVLSSPFMVTNSHVITIRSAPIAVVRVVVVEAASGVAIPGVVRVPTVRGTQCRALISLQPSNYLQVAVSG